MQKFKLDKEIRVMTEKKKISIFKELRSNSPSQCKVLRNARNFLLANSTTNLPQINLKSMGKVISLKTLGDENSNRTNRECASSIKDTNREYFTGNSTYFVVLNKNWHQTSKLLQNIQRNKSKKVEMKNKLTFNQPSDSGIYMFVERKTFDKSIKRKFVLMKNSYLHLKIKCNKIEFPAKVCIKPDTSNILVNVAYNDENCDLGTKYRSNKFIVEPEYKDHIENMILKVFAFKPQKFSISVDFTMKSKLTRNRRVQGPQGVQHEE